MSGRRVSAGPTTAVLRRSRPRKAAPFRGATPDRQ